MRSFSVESKPLLRENHKSMIWLSYSLLVLGLINTILITAFAFKYDTKKRMVSHLWQLAIMVCFYLIVPSVHHYIFSQEFINIAIVVELSNVIVVVFLATVIIDVVGSCEDGQCILETIFGFALVLVYNLVMSSTCVHFFDRLDELSRIEEESLLNYDVRREKLHHNLLSNIEELVHIKSKFEIVITLEVFLCISTSIMYYHAKNEIGLVNLVINILTFVLLSYRNFALGCSWNAKLEFMESSYHLKFDKVKIMCYGVVVTDRFVILVLGSFLSFALRDLIFGQ